MHFTAALLAGGRSSRMGRDKAFLEIDGVPLWKRQLRILQKLGPTEIFIAGPARPEWSDARWQVVPDAIDNGGPLAGLVAVLRRCTTSRLLALAVDLPNMSSNYLERLLSSCQSGKGVIPRNGERFEPLVALYPVACLPLAERLLGGTTSVSSGKTVVPGRNRVCPSKESPDGTEPVPPRACSLQELAMFAVEQGLAVEKIIAREDELYFFNLNTPDDYAVAGNNRSHAPVTK